MAALPIPKEAEPGVAKLMLLSEKTNEELIAALESAPLSFGYDQVAASVAEKVKSIDPESVHDVIQVLASLYLIRAKAKVEIPAFISDFIEGIKKTDLNDKFSKVPVDSFKQWLTRFLQVKALTFTTNARATQKNFENTFCTGEISTDIRPLFDSMEEKTAPLAALITHTLKISYHHGNAMRDLFIGLTSDDLGTLEDLVEQARSESERLQPLLDAAKISYPKDEAE